MRRVSYLNRASRRFLEGTKYRTPYEAVEAGIRTLAEWTEVLTEEREAEAQFMQTRSLVRRTARTGRSLRTISA